MKIRKEDVIRETLLPYLQSHYEKLNKKQIFEITTRYIEAVYLRNGMLHAEATLEMLENLEEQNGNK